MTALSLRAVTKTFRPHSPAPVHAVRGIDLTVDDGEVVAFLGPNGAGKTTTLDMVLGLSAPTTGTVTVFGTPPRNAIRDGLVAAVLQTGGLLRDVTVRETVAVIAAQYRSHLPVAEVLERAGLTQLAGRRVSKCSGGEQQRLRFALALLPDPRLIILDEPTAGMDISGRIQFWNAMRAERHRTVVFATHYLEEAQEFADRIVLINHGRLVADGATRDIRTLTRMRTVTCETESPQEVADAVVAADPTAHVRQEDGRLQIETADSDALLPVVLAAGGHEIEVAAPSLEAAFLALTGTEEDK